MSRTEPEVVVVGAGLAGLAVAAELGRESPVVLVDRLPMYGGVLGFEHPLVASLARDCTARGVSLQLATTAVRWESQRALLVGAGGIVWTASRQLVVAIGNRPSTQAELGIAGERLAGVVPATVAIHLAEARVRLGRRVVVIGSGCWADHCIEAIRGKGTTVISLSLPGDRPSAQADEAKEGWLPVRVDGKTRVERLTVARAGAEDVIECDAVVLAARARPLRNVDGAIWPDSRHVAFVQLAVDRLTAEEVVADARAAAAAMRASTEGVAG